jgi:hypothetical protein
MLKDLHVFKQPLHTTLIQYRFLYVTSIFFLGFFMDRMWLFYEANYASMTTESAAGFFAFAATVLGAFVSCVNNARAPHT